MATDAAEELAQQLVTQAFPAISREEAVEEVRKVLSGYTVTKKEPRYYVDGDIYDRSGPCPLRAVAFSCCERVLTEQQREAICSLLNQQHENGE